MFNHRRARAATQLGALAFLLQGCNLNGQTPKTTLSNGEVLEQDMADSSVSTRTLQPLAVTTAKIADAAITAAKIDSTMSLSVANATVATALTATTGFTVGSALTVNATTFTVASGINTTFNDTITLTKTATLTAGTQNGVYGTVTAAPGGASTANTYAGYFYVPHSTASGTSGSEIGVTGYAYNNNSGTISKSVGGQAISENAALGSLTESDGVLAISQNTNNGSIVSARAVYAQINDPSTGAITNAYGVDSLINNTSTATFTTAYALRGRLVNSGGGTVTTYHGLHLDDPGTGIAANQYNIYSAGNVYNYIGGRLGVKTTTPAYEIDVTGDINATGCLRSSAGTASGVCVSDRRLKKDIADYDVGLDALVKLQPKTYKFNGLAGTVQGQEEVGFIAQELEKVLPSLVVTKKVKLHADDKQETEIKAVNYTRFPWIAYNAVRQLYAKWAADHETLGRQGEQLAAMKKTVEIENLALKAENQRLKDRLDKIELALAQAAPAKAIPAKKGRKLAAE